MSSDSLLRPSSSLSIRPTSRTSQRPLSRFSQISTTRQTRINPWLKTLIRQVVGVDEVCNLEDFQEAWGIASRHVDQLMQSSSAELSRVDAQINGHVTKAQIHVQDVLANKLRVIYSKLMYCMESQRSGLDAVINPSNIPTIVQFLVSTIMCVVPKDPSSLNVLSCIFLLHRTRLLWLTRQVYAKEVILNSCIPN